MGQNEDYGPGNSISDSSEKLLWRGSGEGRYICDFGEGDQHTFLQKAVASLVKFTASHEEQVSPLMTLMPF